VNDGEPRPLRGRPPSTTHAEVCRVALDLFAARGFEQTTMDDIATALGIGRRTLFRYFGSKNDMVWGDFDWVLTRLREDLATADPGMGLMDALRVAVVASNTYPDAELPELRIRMTLITTVPALQAHSMLRYTEWREVVAEFVAQRTDAAHDALVPTAVGYAALAASTAAFSYWVAHPDESLAATLDRTYSLLASGFPLA
jgi:TetR/AcrR family transcriptional regulator, regulator of mycofactocin system